METINTIELKNPDIYPDNTVLEAVLGPGFSAYESLMDLYRLNGMVPEWKYYRDGKAWLCKVQRGKKTIVWMSAWKEYMQASMYIPEKYIEAVYGLDVSDNAKNKFRATKNTGKSRAFIFEIRDNSILVDFEPAMKFKMSLK